MSLTRDVWEKLILLIIGAVVGALLSPLGQFLWWQWRDPDVRYGTGGAYIHSRLAIATVWLKNYGGSDAENVTITASFADPFTNFSTGFPVVMEKFWALRNYALLYKHLETV